MPQYQGIWNLAQQAQALTRQQWVTDPVFDQTTLLLQADNAANGAQNNTFLDSSSNAFAITRNGNTTQGSFSPFSATGWSGFFGTGNYLNSTFNQAFTGTTNFCFETWMYLTAMPTQEQFWFLSVQSGIFCDSWVNSSLGVEVRIGSSTGTTLASTSKVTINAWNHVAVTFDGTTLRIFINGVPSGSTSFTMFTGTTTRYVVAYNDYVVDPRYFTGYLSNWRVSVGTPRYTAAFTPSPTPFVADANTIILLLQSNRFNDTSGNNRTIVPTGTPSIQAFSPFAPQYQYTPTVTGGSGYFDGTGDYLVCGVASDWTFMSNTTALWSFEAWIYPTSLGTIQSIFDTAASTTGNVGVSMQINANRTIQVEIYYGSAGNRVVSGSSTSAFVANQWNHILVTYDQSLASQNLKFYINGGSAETINKTGNTPSSSAPNRAFTIATYGPGSGQFLFGYIGSMRVSNVIRSSGTPTAPYTSDANTKLLCSFTNAGILDGTMKNDLETLGNAQVSTSIVKYGSGSMSFDGTGDYLSIAARPSFAFGTGDFTIEFWMWSTVNSLDSFYRRIYMTDGPTGNAAGNFQIAIVPTTGVINLWTNSGGLDVSGTSNVTDGVWHHIAAVRLNGNLRLYVDGVQQLSTTYTTSISPNSGSPRPYIGSYDGTQGDYNGYLDDFRITNGIARYTRNFTPPQVALPRQ